MHEFFQKHGSYAGDPYEAIEIMCQKLYKIKDKVAKGDPSHIQDMSTLSDMIDDYVRAVQGREFKPVNPDRMHRGYDQHKPQGYRESGHDMWHGYPHPGQDHNRGMQPPMRDWRDDNPPYLQR